MNWPEPSTSSASLAEPPSKASPSMRPTKSMTTWSPSCAAASSPSRASKVRLSVTSSVHRRVDFRFLGLVDEALEAEFLDAGRLELRHHLDVEVVGEVFAPGEHLIHVGDRLQVRLGGDAQLIVREDLLRGLVEGLLDHLAHQGLAIQPPDVGRRHLARPEALEVQGGQDLGDPRVQSRPEIGRGHPHGVAPAQAFVCFFDDFHRQRSECWAPKPPAGAGANKKGRRQDPSWPAARTSGPYVTPLRAPQVRGRAPRTPTFSPDSATKSTDASNGAKLITVLLSSRPGPRMMTTPRLPPIFCPNSKAVTLRDFNFLSQRQGKCQTSRRNHSFWAPA